MIGPMYTYISTSTIECIEPLNGDNSFPLLGSWHLQPPLDIHVPLPGTPYTVVFFRHRGSNKGILKAHNVRRHRYWTRNCKGVKSPSVFYKNSVISPMSPIWMTPLKFGQLRMAFESWLHLYHDSRESICSGSLYVAVSIAAVDTSQDKTNEAVNTNIKSSLGNRGSKMLAM